MNNYYTHTQDGEVYEVFDNTTKVSIAECYSMINAEMITKALNMYSSVPDWAINHLCLNGFDIYLCTEDDMHTIENPNYGWCVYDDGDYIESGYGFQTLYDALNDAIEWIKEK